MTSTSASTRIAAATLLLATASLSVAHDAQNPGPSRSQSVTTIGNVDARFRLPHAIEKAEREAPGKATAAEFSPFPNGGGALEVTVMRPDKTVVKYRVDANTGETVNVTEQTIEGYVTRLDPPILSASRVSMTSAIAAAEARVAGGTAIGAEAQRDNDALTYEVTVLKDGAETDLTVAQDGRVAER